jgi:ATPase subunit of ABC transporter with duplicated ATPase domains
MTSYRASGGGGHMKTAGIDTDNIAERVVEYYPEIRNILYDYLVEHKSIDPDKTVYQTIADDSDFVRLGNKEVNARAYVSRFNFSGADQEKKCGILSGGERNRLHLALTLKEEANVLLLDEPTNDVDVNTIRALEEGLENFAGCAVVISHDRWFLDRIATHILAFEGESKVYFFEGSYSEYEENKKMRLGNVEPKRFKYKKLKD